MEMNTQPTSALHAYTCGESGTWLADRISKARSAAEVSTSPLVTFSVVVGGYLDYAPRQSRAADTDADGRRQMSKVRASLLLGHPHMSLRQGRRGALFIPR